jgi:hypothetical protein
MESCGCQEDELIQELAKVPDQVILHFFGMLIHGEEVEEQVEEQVEEKL